MEMLQGIKHYYEEFHAVTIPDEVLRRAVVLSERYITDRFLPDKAIDLIDEAAAHRSLSSAVLAESYEVRDKLLELRNKRETLEGEIAGNAQVENSRYEEISNIQSEELRLSARLDELEPETHRIELTENDIADVIELWTGIPATTITENEFRRIDRLEERLKEHIVGQDAAVEAVARAIKRSRAGISYKRKPVSFIFAGPTGVGIGQGAGKRPVLLARNADPSGYVGIHGETRGIPNHRRASRIRRLRRSGTADRKDPPQTLFGRAV